MSFERYAKLKEQIDHGRLVLLDGGIGTEILRRGASWASHRIESEPDLVRQIHADYIRAGADVITTNTFQLTRTGFRHHFNDTDHMTQVGAKDLDVKAGALIRDAVQLARDARTECRNDSVVIAAGITMVQWCFRPDLSSDSPAVKDEYRETIEAFVDAGVDLLLFETFNSIAEANVALDAAREIGAPAWMAFAPDGGNRLLGGEPIAQAVEEVYCDVMLLNCAPPAHIETGLDTLAKRRSGPVGVYPHIGRFDPPEWMFTDEFPPDRYASEAARWFRTGARVIGGCCGVTPAHTDAVNRQLRNTIEPVPGKSEEQ